jgi:hypothetical protein
VQPALEIMAEGNRAMLDDTLSPVDQGWGSYFGILEAWVMQVGENS